MPSPVSCARLAEYSGGSAEKVLALAGHFPKMPQTAPADWPEFREYIERRYPSLDEAIVDVFEAHIDRKLTGPRGS